MEIHQLKCDQCGKIEANPDKSYLFGGGSRMKWRLIRSWPNGINDYCSDKCLRAAIAENLDKKTANFG